MSIEKILADIPESEKTPLLLMLIQIIKQQAQKEAELKEEITRLKGNPVKPKLKHSKTSKIDKQEQKKSQNSKKKSPRKSVRRKKI